MIHCYLDNIENIISDNARLFDKINTQQGIFEILAKKKKKKKKKNDIKSLT